MEHFAKSLLIIIVVYKRALEACESFRSVLGMQVSGNPIDICIYDNSPSPQNIKDYGHVNIKYVHDRKNSGVSKAYNVGVEQAREMQKEWVLLLDQDTKLPGSILKNFKAAITANPKIDLFVPILKLKNGKIFSPSLYKFKRGFFLDQIEPGKHSLYKYAPVNSGMMVRTKTFLDIGGYNEKVKLDFSDFQFIERFRRKHHYFLVLNVECEQDFSDDDNSFRSQVVRFSYFCEGARNMEDKSVWDWLQYNAVVFIRALRLTFRYGKWIFLDTYFRKFLFA